jgi:hypothetical protein
MPFKKYRGKGHPTHSSAAATLNTQALSRGSQHTAQLRGTPAQLGGTPTQLHMFSTHLGFLRRKIPSHGSVLYLCDRGDTWSQSGEDVLQSQIAAWVRERGRA